MATVSSKSRLVAPMRIATANPCSISSAPAPMMWQPTIFCSGPDANELHVGVGLARRQGVVHGREVRDVDLDRVAVLRARFASLAPTVPMGGWVNTTVGIKS